MSTLSKNKKYLAKLLKKVTLATDVYTQQVIMQSFSWLTTMTVQDSGNAAANWQISVNGQQIAGFDHKGLGRATSVGARGEIRRPLDEISSSDTLNTLSGLASATPLHAVEKGWRQVFKVKMNEVYEFPSVSMVSNIDQLGEGYDQYARRALPEVRIGQAEMQKFGEERGKQLAMSKSEVKRVT